MASSPAPSAPKSSLSRFAARVTIPSSRDHSPESVCSSTDDGSRSSSRRRPSFGSIKEDVDGIAQSFVDTQISSSSSSSQSPKDHHACDRQGQGFPTALEMQQTPDFCCPCGGFLGWKQIRLGGRKLSRSYSDLRLLGSTHSRGWAWEASPAVTPSKAKPLEIKQPKSEASLAPIELLPPEILDQIISNLALDVPPNGYTPRNVDLISCLLTSRTLHAATLGVLYRNMTFPHSVIFSKALSHMSQYPALGTLVRRLDFSHFTSVGLGRTKQMNIEIQNLTSTTLLKCLDLLPNLRECLLQEHIEGDISADIVHKLFTGLPNLDAVDFCGCSSQSFSRIFLDGLTADQGLPMVLPNLKRVSLHECSGLPPRAFEILLPRLVNLTHLDLTHTQITEAALFSIPDTANITHLSLSRCSRISGPRVVEFLTTHPAVCNSLAFLNLMTDPSRFRLLEEDDVKALLPKLPTSLRSLNLGGARVNSDHVPMLVTLTKHLQELGLSGADLSVKDLNAFFIPPSTPKSDALDSEAGFPEAGTVDTEKKEETPWSPPTLCYLDLNKVPQMSVGAIFNMTACALLSPQSYPLQVVEFSDKLIAPLRERSKNGRPTTGWTVRELGRRGWYVRDPATMPPHQRLDDGARWWKMGARWWGMRKIPVAVGDVGGIYGHYMFKK